MSQKQRAAHQLRRQKAAPGPPSARLDLKPLLHEVQQSYNRNDLATAERLLRQLLSYLPHNAESLHLLGIILYRTGRLEEAAISMSKSVASEGTNPAWRSNFGLLLQAQGKLDDAAEQYRHALRLHPGHPEAHNNLGNILQLRGQWDEAASHYREAIRLKPDYPDAHTNLGAVAKAQGRIDEAITHYRQALALKPAHPAAHYNLGNALAGAEPGSAAAAFQQAVAADPASARAHYNLGNALAAQDKHDEALAEYKSALLLDPAYLDAHHNIGVSLQATNRLDEALAWYGRTLELQPGHAKAHFHTGMIHLLRGDLPTGWPHYEHRHLATPEAAMRTFAQPQWRGEPLLGRRILLHPEQGLGDTLQFLRYVPMVQAAGGRVVLLVQPSLRRLAADLPGQTEAIELVEDEQNLPPFDLHCPLLSLPLAFGTTLETIPAPVPYLTVPEPELAHAATLRWPASGLRVGLVWAGNPVQGRDRFRSLPLAAYEPLLHTAGVHFFSLQAGPCAMQLRFAGASIANLNPDLDNMADTAAKLLHLDLVITVCTSVAHLAGALGVPTWVLLPNPADWRWLQDRNDSPWYPSARLFRQPTPSDWSTVIAAVHAELAQLAQHPPRTSYRPGTRARRRLAPPLLKGASAILTSR